MRVRTINVCAAVAAAAISLTLAQGCSTSSRDAPTRTRTISPTATISPTHTFTFSPTPNPVTPTPTPCAVTCSPNWSWFTGLTQAGLTALYPQSTPQTAGSISLIGNDFWQFDFCAVSGTTYWFSVCQYGGTYFDDTVFELFNQSCVSQGMDDDTCSTGSELSWPATFTGPATLGVTNFYSGSETFTLAYWTQ